MKLFRNLLVILIDITLVSFAWVMSFILRFNFEIPENYIESLMNLYPAIFLTFILPYLFFRVDNLAIRHFSINDLLKIISSLGVGWILLSFIFLINFNTLIEIRIPRSIIFLYPILSALFLIVPRVIYRIFFEKYSFIKYKGIKKNILIIGSGAEAISLAKLITSDPVLNCSGFLTTDKTLWNRELLGISVYGSIDLLEDICFRNNISTVILSINNISYDEKKNIIDAISHLSLEALIAPSVEELLSGRLSINNLRKINIEDLLGRKKSDLDNINISAMINSKTVLVSGAGGSIGSELCRQISSFNPKTLLCIDISEASLYKLQQNLESSNSKINLIYFVTDIKNETKVNSILEQYKPSVVFHAAAYKHVPLMEEFNISEAFKNNSLGTYIFGKLCQKNNIKKFILISTDKAVNPTSIMGASKRLAEIFCQKISQKNNNTQFITVRFGNVLASSGSVIPLFEKQIQDGGPITITHPNITRYFMTITEASQLVLQAALMGIGGEIYILEMGNPIKIVDLAKDMIRLSGLNNDDIKIVYTGLRKGEKLFEETLLSNENVSKTHHSKIMIAKFSSERSDFSLIKAINWIKTIDSKSDKDIRVNIKTWVPEYKNLN